MADNKEIADNTGSGVRAATDEVSYSGQTADVQIVRIAQVTGAEGSKTVVDLPGDTANGLDVDVTRVPTDPFGANADAASATGSISAKLRYLAATGINILSIATGDNNIGNVDVLTLPISYGGGIVDGTTQRTTLAADDPAVIFLASIESLTSLIKDSASVLDDWDETNRCASNIIPGQVGVASNAGANSANTVRVTIATDDSIHGATYVDNAAWTDNVSKHKLIGGIYQSVPQTVTDGRTAPFQVDVNGNLKTVVTSLPVAFNTGVLGTTTQRVTIATDDPILTTIGISIGNVEDSTGVMATWNETGRCAVNPISGQAGLQGGSGTASANTLRVTQATDVNVTTVGTIAHDSPDSSNPHKIGAKATTSLSGKTMVADNDRTDLFAGTDGVQITRPHCNLEDIVTGNASNTDGNSTQCIAAQAAGIKTYLTSIILTNTSASNIYVEIKDGTTVKLTIPVPANGGAIFNPPVPLPGTAATAWNFDGSAAATTLYCSMIGFKSKV